jgi:hypothetical protein
MPTLSVQVSRPSRPIDLPTVLSVSQAETRMLRTVSGSSASAYNVSGAPSPASAPPATPDASGPSTAVSEGAPSQTDAEDEDEEPAAAPSAQTTPVVKREPSTRSAAKRKAQDEEPKATSAATPAAKRKRAAKTKTPVALLPVSGKVSTFGLSVRLTDGSASATPARRTRRSRTANTVPTIGSARSAATRSAAATGTAFRAPDGAPTARRTRPLTRPRSSPRRRWANECASPRRKLWRPRTRKRSR